MIQIVKVAPLTPIEAAQMAEAEKQVGISLAVYETRKKEYFAALETLKKRYDQNFEKNSRQQISRYAAQVKDGCLVVTLE